MPDHSNQLGQSYPPDGHELPSDGQQALVSTSIKERVEASPGLRAEPERRTVEQIQREAMRENEAALFGESLVCRLERLKENGLLDAANRATLIQNNKYSPVKSFRDQEDPQLVEEGK